MATFFKAFVQAVKGGKTNKLQPWTVFKELGESLNLIEDFEPLALNILGRIKDILPVRDLALFIYDREAGRFKVAAALGFPDVRLDTKAFFRSDRIAKWLKVNQTLFDVRNEPGIFASLSPREKEIVETLRISLCFPVVSMNRLIGILALGPVRGGQEFPRQGISLLTSLLPQAGIALENALLYREQRDRVRRMVRADRLATVGELAAGAAHEIRNPLTAIKSSLQYLGAHVHDEAERKLLGSALKETERIEEILSALLTFSRPSEIKKETHDVRHILEESLELITFQVKNKQVSVRKDFPTAALDIQGDKSQLKQLFLNLLLNALQAIGAGGEIKVEAGSANDHMAVVAIRDNGEGIAEENLEKIYDPFFTTKKGGTGLGLSICYSIVRAHEGEIEVESKPGRGTTVRVRLPLA